MMTSGLVYYKMKYNVEQRKRHWLNTPPPPPTHTTTPTPPRKCSLHRLLLEEYRIFF